MTTTCFSAVQGISSRFTRLTSCCDISYGACGTVVSEGFVTFTATAEIEEPTEIVVKTAAGKICINELGVASLKRYNVEMSFCRAHPDIFEMAAGVNKVLNFAGNTVGYSTDQSLGFGTKFGLEIWSRIPAEACTAGGRQQYVYFLFPCLTNGRLGDVSIEDGAVDFVLTAQAIPSDVWGVGPYDVVAQNGAFVAGALLAPIPNETGYLVQVTDIAPPSENFVNCGCTTLLVNS